MARSKSHKEHESPLFEKTEKTPYSDRAFALVHIGLFIIYLGFRLKDPIEQGCYGIWVIAVACEVYFAFTWVLEHNLRWHDVSYVTHLDRFNIRYGGSNATKLPNVDVIITTADHRKEPPLVTMNTVMSVLAMDYPVEKFACYLSDDGASTITYYSLILLLDFAKLWVPFCKKYKVETRAPSVYFAQKDDNKNLDDDDFIKESGFLKQQYESFKRKITKAVESEEVPLNFGPKEGFAFQNKDISNHSSVVKVIHEWKGGEDVPHLIYVAREKRPKILHRYKAGAMNVMARVSAVMTNAPYILNLDCDMFVNNAYVIRYAMCFFLGCKNERDFGFVQYPQMFYSNDNTSASWFTRMSKGLNGMKTAVYCGTCCLHRRKALYGQPPNVKNISASWSLEDLIKKFGQSFKLIESAKESFQECERTSTSPLNMVEEALKVSSSSYEINTSWGKELGWEYGSTVEDVLTGMKIHSLGWSSIFYSPKRPGFLGTAPSIMDDVLDQQRRWVGGLLKIFFSDSCPFLGWKRKLTMQSRMMYAYFSLWGVYGVVLFCYTILPIYSLLKDKSSLTQVYQPTFAMASCLFLLSYGYRLQEFLKCGVSLNTWWSYQKMWTISCISSYMFGTLDVAMEILKVSDMVFTVTPKDLRLEEDTKQEESLFSSSTITILPTAILLLSLVAISVSSLKLLHGEYVSEYCCCVWTIINLWSYMKALVTKGKGGLPWTIVFKSILLALLVSLSWKYI